MKKILICSPVRGGVGPAYVRNLIAILNANWGGKYLFNWAATSGTSVAWARDELADTALAIVTALLMVFVGNPFAQAPMTGLRPDTIGIYDLATNFRKAAPAAVTPAPKAVAAAAGAIAF